jgi:hypothetical protein
VNYIGEKDVMKYIMLHCKLLYSTLLYTTLHYTTLHYTTQHNTTLHYTTTLHLTTLLSTPLYPYLNKKNDKHHNVYKKGSAHSQASDVIIKRKIIVKDEVTVFKKGKKRVS